MTSGGARGIIEKRASFQTLHYPRRRSDIYTVYADALASTFRHHPTLSTFTLPDETEASPERETPRASQAGAAAGAAELGGPGEVTHTNAIQTIPESTLLGDQGAEPGLTCIDGTTLSLPPSRELPSSDGHTDEPAVLRVASPPASTTPSSTSSVPSTPLTPSFTPPPSLLSGVSQLVAKPKTWTPSASPLITHSDAASRGGKDWLLGRDLSALGALETHSSAHSLATFDTFAGDFSTETIQAEGCDDLCSSADEADSACGRLSSDGGKYHENNNSRNSEDEDQDQDVTFGGSRPLLDSIGADVYTSTLRTPSHRSRFALNIDTVFGPFETPLVRSTAREEDDVGEDADRSLVISQLEWADECIWVPSPTKPATPAPSGKRKPVRIQYSLPIVSVLLTQRKFLAGTSTSADVPPRKRPVSLGIVPSSAVKPAIPKLGRRVTFSVDETPAAKSMRHTVVGTKISARTKTPGHSTKPTVIRTAAIGEQATTPIARRTARKASTRSKRTLATITQPSLEKRSASTPTQRCQTTAPVSASPTTPGRTQSPTPSAARTRKSAQLKTPTPTKPLAKTTIHNKPVDSRSSRTVKPTQKVAFLSPAKNRGLAKISVARPTPAKVAQASVTRAYRPTSLQVIAPSSRAFTAAMEIQRARSTTVAATVRSFSVASFTSARASTLGSRPSAVHRDASEGYSERSSLLRTTTITTALTMNSTIANRGKGWRL